jgi:hypothetical protein
MRILVVEDAWRPAAVETVGEPEMRILVVEDAWRPAAVETVGA